MIGNVSGCSWECKRMYWEDVMRNVKGCIGKMGWGMLEDVAGRWDGECERM